MTESEESRSPLLNPESWGAVVAGYESNAESLTGMFVDDLLEAAGPCEGCRLLDVAAGPGVVALNAARLGARVTAVDFSDEMVDRASTRLQEAGFEKAECHATDFESMPFEDDRFDIAVSNFGLMFAPNPPKAFGELARVLDPGGRLATTCWTAPERQDFFRTVRTALERSFPELVPPGPPIWERFSDADAVIDYLEASGFTDANVETVNRPWRHPSPDSIVDVIDVTNPSVSELFESLTDDEKARFKNSLRDVLVDEYGDGPLAFSAEAHVASATAL